MVATKKKPMAQRNSGTLLHAPINRKKKSTNNRARKAGSLFGVAPEVARLTVLENTLVLQAQNPITSFDAIHTVSNPGVETSTGFKVLQIWFETYRTIERNAINQIIHETQE